MVRVVGVHVHMYLIIIRSETTALLLNILYMYKLTVHVYSMYSPKTDSPAVRLVDLFDRGTACRRR